jgi:hypothetical protein
MIGKRKSNKDKRKLPCKCNRSMNSRSTLRGGATVRAQLNQLLPAKKKKKKC